ncbi:SirA family protein [Brachyspira hyodysenteriae]|uniref:SirA family protein n=1 Tax=Brachyspira hyodysenteriae TaxID=159 RepID=UPI00063DBE0B|nr:SirA family protein [Brachyspira hyodysenteriae]KLI38676.1 SirA family protein [Brachyspira hyodysenteriae]
MPDTIKVDTRGMLCSQASFQAKCAAINTTELNTIIEVLVSGHSSCESVIRGCKKYGYEGTFKNIENEDILVTLTKVK